MKRIFFSAILVAVVISLASCGANRKLGCPATAKSATQAKSVSS
jgi:predicted small lipoprotein YifL